jgi:hypothetical protein
MVICRRCLISRLRVIAYATSIKNLLTTAGFEVNLRCRCLSPGVMGRLALECLLKT